VNGQVERSNHRLVCDLGLRDAFVATRWDYAVDIFPRPCGRRIAPVRGHYDDRVRPEDATSSSTRYPPLFEDVRDGIPYSAFPPL
jgi:hypothetical protein